MSTGDADELRTGRTADLDRAGRDRRPPSALKLGLARGLSRLWKLRQIHIVGCARSGTTMAQIAMLGFDDVLIPEQETGPDYPGLGQVVALRRQGMIGHRPHMLVTKRGFNWHDEEHLARLRRRLQTEPLGLIHLVRDPRDVLASAHTSAHSERGYVSPERWRASVRAGEQLVAGVEGRNPVLTLRYEDFVHDPLQVERLLASTFELRRRDGVTSIADLEQVLRVSGMNLAPNRSAAMHKVRPIDAASVGRGRDNPGVGAQLRADPGLRADIDAFLERHGYAR